MRRSILGAVAAFLLVTGCAPANRSAADTAGQFTSVPAALPVVQATPPRAVTDQSLEFVRRIVGDTEDVWTALFKAMGARYDPPKVLVFNSVVQSGCGLATMAAGPFYCQADRKVYLDTAFFSEAGRSLGDFAQAYLIVHEISHHVQNALGTTDRVESSMPALPILERNELRVRLELQADCYTGVWAYFVQKRNLLEPGGLDDEVAAAQVLSDASTHGTLAQRLRWFNHGLASGDPRECDTFKALRS
jgi:uncharacterized protein